MDHAYWLYKQIRMMYIHASQGYLFNATARARVRNTV